MPVSVRKINDKFRIVEPGGDIATTPQGHAKDGGGHKTKAEASAQARAINEGISGKGGTIFLDDPEDPPSVEDKFYPPKRNA